MQWAELGCMAMPISHQLYQICLQARSDFSSLEALPMIPAIIQEAILQTRSRHVECVQQRRGSSYMDLVNMSRFSQKHVVISAGLAQRGLAWSLCHDD